MTRNALASIVLLLLVGLILPANLAASSSRDGLWHALEKENGSTLFYLVYSDEEIRAYTADWGRVNAKFEVSDNMIRFRIPVGTTHHLVEARFEGDGRVAGKYTRPHTQDTWDMEWTARHVSPDPDWEPWGFLKGARAGVVNLAESVISGGPFENEKQFVAFWEKNIDPRYYVLLSSTAYYDLAQPDFQKARRRMLSEYYGTLKENWHKLESFSKSFASMQEKVVKDLKKLYPWLKLSGYLVPGLSPGKAEYAYMALPAGSVNPKRFLVLDAAWISSHLSDTQRRYLTAQMLLTLEHLSSHPRNGSIRAEFLHRGLAAYMASGLDYSKDPKDFLFQVERDEGQRETAYRAFALQLSKHFKAKAFRVRKDFFLGDHRASSYLFAYDFVGKLAERFELQLLLHRFPYDRLRFEMVAYIRSVKEIPKLAATDPAPAKPAQK